MRFPRTRMLLTAAAAAVLTAAATTAAPAPLPSPAPAPEATLAADDPVVDMVEEDWQLVVDTPDLATVGPQITTCMCPLGDLTQAPYVAFDMNYREVPSFRPGGMQLQIWNGKRLLGYTSQGSGQFSTTGETVTWTQRLSSYGNWVMYDVTNGNSTTFGQFGQGEWLTAWFAAPVSNLNGYDPDVSAASSGASWESDHVRSLKLLRVRYYANGQLLWTDSNARTLVGQDDDTP